MTATLEQLAPGVHKAIAFTDYCTDPGVNASTLKLFTNRTPKHAKHDLDQPDDDTESLAIGHASHTAVLEPALFDDLYAVYPKAEYVDTHGHPNSKAYKQARDDWYDAHADSIIITDEQHEHAMAIREAVERHPLASKLLMHNRGASELTIIGEHEHKDEPVRVKARIDRLTTHEGFPMVVDLKTMATKGGVLNPRAVSHQITQYGYHQQAAWYLDRLNDHRPADRMFVFVFVENAPPYDCVCYALEPESIEQGRRDNERALAQLVRGRKTNRWPGFSDLLQSIQIRDYAMTEGE